MIMEMVINALADAEGLDKQTKEILQAFAEILKHLDKEYEKLKAEAANVKKEFSNFQNALGEAKAASAVMEKRYEAFKIEYGALWKFAEGVSKRKPVRGSDITDATRMIGRVLASANKCLDECSAVKEKLEEAIKDGVKLSAGCKNVWQSGEDNAADTRIVGYGIFTVASLGAVAVAAGYLVTGGLGALVIAVGAVVVGLRTLRRANRLDKLVADFKTLYAKVENDLKKLNQMADNTVMVQVMTQFEAERLQNLLARMQNELNSVRHEIDWQTEKNY